MGIIGAGLIGAKRARAAKTLGVLAGIFDRNQAAARALAKELGSRFFDTQESLLDSLPERSWVIIATPNRFLCEVGADVLKAGHDVFLEKPGATNSIELRKLLEEASSVGRKVLVGYNHRFHPAVAAAKKIIDTRALGHLLFVRARYGHGGRPGYEKEWRFRKEISGGGELLDQGSHLLDLTAFLCGDFVIEGAVLSGKYWSGEVEETAFLLAKAAGSVPVSLHASWTEWKNLFSLEIMLERGKVEVSGLGGSYGLETLYVYDMGEESRVPDLSITNFEGPDSSWTLELQAAIESSKSRKLNSTGAEAVRILEMIEEIYS